MKQSSRIVSIVLMIVNIILIVICCVLYFQADRTAPQLEFQAGEQIYLEDMDQTELLQNVIARDDTDGDITDRIVIEKIVTNREERTAVVFYAVSDRAGNVTKKSREFPAVYNQTGSTEEAEETADTEQKRMEELTPEPTVEPTQEPAQTPVPTATVLPTITPIPEPTVEPTQEPAPQPTRNPAIPILTLKVSEVSTNVGEAPAWVNVIQNLSDDKDKYETLFQNLKISKYDINKAGSYAVTVATEDSDGNVSAAVPITIHVK